MANNTVLIQNGLSVSPLAANPSSSRGKFVPSYTPSLSPQAIQPRMDTYTSITNLRYPVDTPKYYIQIGAFDYKRNTALTVQRPTLNNIENFILPLPSHLVDSHNVSYDQKSLGIVAGVTSEFLGGRFTSAGRADTTSDDIPYGEGAKGYAAWFLRKFGKGGLDEAARAFFGYSPNDFLTVLLNGPAYKTFGMKWVFSPRNEQESIILRKLILLLNNAMAPGITGAGSIFTFPKIFLLGYYPNAKALYKFKPCVLTNMAVNYSGSGQPAFFRASPESDNLSHPESIQLSLQFMEIEFWITGDFKDVDDPNDTFAVVDPNKPILPW